MKIFIQFLIIISAVFAAKLSAVEHPQVFEQTNWQQIKQQHLGQRWMVLLWSLDCPPCFKELALVQKLTSQDNKLSIVLINVDDNDALHHERNEVIKKFALTGYTNLYFADGLADSSRYMIDPQWYGELPRSYFIEESGRFHGKSGLVKQSLLKQWFTR